MARDTVTLPLFGTALISPDGEDVVSGPEMAKPKFIDLFCGCGGLACGFREAGFKSVFALDIDPAAAETYRRNFGHDVFDHDIALLDRIPVKAEVIIGGPPCQGFSPLGKMSPSEAVTKHHVVLNTLWRHYLRVVDIVQPKVFVVENVPELLRSGEYVLLVQEAERRGYQVVSGVLNAVDYGVPQQRRRAIIIASRAGRPALPEPTGERRTVRDAIGHLPLKPTGKDWHIGRNPTPKSIERYKCIRPGENRFALVKKRRDLAPRCWIEKKTGSTDVFGRLEWDKPALTIRTEFFKPEKGRYLHPEAHRPITHREAMLLQTFPPTFVFPEEMAKIQIARQVGNAMPPELAYAVAKAVLRLLESRRRSKTPADTDAHPDARASRGCP
ncbi:MAG: DNA cytosine methyltransferase [Myxococcota bacterium]|nr:DNA cytosine methyltransferase [Myxococcota bacterium]